MGRARGEASGRAAEAAVYLFAASLGLSIAGANIGWVLFGVALLWRTADGIKLDWSTRSGSLELPLYAFLLASFLASAFGESPQQSLRFFHQDLHKFWIVFLFSVGLPSARTRNLPKALAAGFAAAALVGMAQTTASLIWPHADGLFIRAHAFVHPVTFGAQMCTAALGAGAYALLPSKSGSGTQSGERKWAAALLLLFLAALFLSHARAALLSFGAGAGAALLLLPRGRRALWIIVPLLLAVFLATEFLRPDRSILPELLGWKTMANSNSQLMRLTLWKVAWNIGWDHPLTGIGHNMFRAVLPRYYSGLFDGANTSFGTAHNLYLHHFAERGLLGLTALAWLLWSFWKRALDRARAQADACQLWGFGSATAFLILNLTEVALQTEILWMLVFFIWVWCETEFRKNETAAR